MSGVQTTEVGAWFYEDKGQRKGPVSEGELVQFIKSSVVPRGTSVWRQGLAGWLTIENTELGVHFDHAAPPPLVGESVNNTLVWVLAFAPLIGYFLEWVVAGAVYGDNELAAAVAMANSKFWFVTYALNVALGFFDEKKLTAAGHDTGKFKGWVWLVPVYLYQRAKATRQNLAYFITWIVCMVLVLFA